MYNNFTYKAWIEYNHERGTMNLVWNHEKSTNSQCMYASNVTCFTNCKLSTLKREIVKRALWESKIEVPISFTLFS